MQLTKHPFFKPLVWLFHPIRLSGMLAILFLAGPGSLLGLSMLLMHAGAAPWLTPVAPQIHALMQILGFFMLLIWGFLVHGLPGMMGASALRTRWIRLPMLITATGLWLIWGAAAGGGSGAWENAAWMTLLLGTLSGSWVLISAAIKMGERCLERPIPMLLFPLAVPPLGVWAAWQRPEWLNVGGPEIILTLGLVPLILAMTYRLFPSMMGLEYPRARLFDAGMALWGIGWGLRIGVDLSPTAALATDGIIFAATLTLALALRVGERTRDGLAGDRRPTLDRSLLLHIRTSFVFLLLAGLLPLLTNGYDFGSRFYGADLARHFLAIGFSLILVSGITQKVIPIFLRGTPSSALWMNGNLLLLVIGMLLRSTEIFLPATAPWVKAGGYFLVAGILSYALHLLRGMILPNPKYAGARPPHPTPQPPG